MDSKQPPLSPPVRALGEHFETALDRADRAAEPPDYDQLAAYVDGTLDDVDREIVESWLDGDPELRAEVEDLRALHEAMAVPGAAPASPAAAPLTPEVTAGRRGAATSAAATSATRSSADVMPFGRKGVTTRRFGTATVIMGAMAAAAIGAVTWMVVRTARVDDTRPGAAGSQVAEQRPPQQGQPPAVQSQGPGAPQVATNPRQGAPADPSGRNAGGASSPAGSGTGVGSAATEAIALRDAGGLIAVDAAGTVTGLTGLTDDAAAAQSMTQLVADALTNGTLPPGAAAAGLGGRELTLMSRGRQAPAARLAPLSPIATVVRSAQPVFRWSPHPGARGYVVTIYGPDFDQVMASPTLTDTTWTATAALKPGITYQWQVTADTTEGLVRAPAPPAPDARFRVIDAAAGKALDRDLARAGTSQLLKGLLLTQAGVLDEAEAALVALQAVNPDSKRVATLLARVRDRRFSQ